MPAPLTAYVANWKLDYAELQVEFNNLYNDTYNLGTQLTAEGNPNSGNTAFNMAVHILNIRNILGLSSGTMYYNMGKCMEWIDNNWPTGGVVDMDAILQAIWTSDKLRWFHFINYIDSMRAGIWNTEIYGEHLAEWYRHFSI